VSVTRVARNCAQRMFPWPVCVICGELATVEYPGPYVPLEYPAREWLPCCGRHKRHVSRMAAWRRVRVDQEPRLHRCGSRPRPCAANRQGEA